MGSVVTFDSKTRVVVTGGAGFVGSALTDLLLGRGSEVIVLDDLSNGLKTNLPLASANLTFHAITVGDPANTRLLDEVTESANVVVHLASPIGVQRAHEERFAVVRSILASGMAVIDACRRFRRPMLFMSSSEVYGPGYPRPITENDPVMSDIRPRWGYAVAKSAIEHLAAGLFLESGIPSWIVRPFNMAGPRQRPSTGLVVASFADAAWAHRPLIIHGDGSQRRAFLHVADAAEGLISIMQCDALQGRPVNLGGEWPIRIDALAELVKKEAQASVPLVYKTPEVLFGKEFATAGDRLSDSSLIKSLTGWKQTRSTEQIVADCVAFLRPK